jgi:hypothetical protein
MVGLRRTMKIIIIAGLQDKRWYWDLNTKDCCCLLYSCVWLMCTVWCIHLGCSDFAGRCGPSHRQSLAALWGDVSLCVDCGGLFICLPLSILLKQVHWHKCILCTQYINWIHNRMIVSVYLFVFMFHTQKYVAQMCICICWLLWELNLICNFFVQNMMWTEER